MSEDIKDKQTSCSSSPDTSVGTTMSSVPNSSEGRAATRTILEDVCADFETMDVIPPKTNKIGVIRNTRRSSSISKNSGSVSKNSGTKTATGKGTPSHKLSENKEVNDKSIVDRNEVHTNIVHQIESKSQSVEMNVTSQTELLQPSVCTNVHVQSNDPPNSEILPLSYCPNADNITILPESFAVDKNLSSLAQLADAEIVQSGDNVSIVVTNTRFIKVLTDPSNPVSGLQPATVIEAPSAVLETDIAATQEIDIANSALLSNSILHGIHIEDESVVIQEKVVSGRGGKKILKSGALGNRRNLKKMNATRGRPPIKKLVTSQPSYTPSGSFSKARRITARMKYTWARLLEVNGHIVCEMPGCSQTFVTVANFQTHFKYCTGKKTLQKCDYCDSMIFSTHKAILQHMVVEHPEIADDYKAAHSEELAEFEKSSAPTHLLVAEDENVAMNIEEVTQQPLKNSRKRKLSLKESAVPHKKVILKHKLQSIQNSMAENAKEFKKCVRFDAITDTINSVEETCNIAIPSSSIETKRKEKKKRHVFTERIVAENSYFEDDDVDFPKTPEELKKEEQQNLREQMHTKARMVLNLERYKRYQEYLTVTRDWSSERKTYSRSRIADVSAESYLAHIQHELSQDLLKLQNTTDSSTISLNTSEMHNLNNVTDSSTISLNALETEIDTIQMPFSETYQVLETPHFVSAVSLSENVKEYSTSTPNNINNVSHTILNESNLSEHLISSSLSPEAKMKREKIACYNRVNIETPKSRPRYGGIITYGLKVPAEEVNKPVEPPVTFDSLVNFMKPKQVRKNSQTDNETVNVTANNKNIMKLSKEDGIKFPDSVPPKKRGRPSKFKQDSSIDPKAIKVSKIALKKQKGNGTKYSAAMLKSIEKNVKNRQIKLFGAKKNLKFKSKKFIMKSHMPSKKSSKRNIKVKQSARNSLRKKSMKNRKNIKTKSVDESAIQCQENIDNHLLLGQDLDQIPCLSSDHNYTNTLNSLIEGNLIVDANNIAGEVEVVTSNIENISEIADKCEPSLNVSVEGISCITQQIKEPEHTNTPEINLGTIHSETDIENHDESEKNSQELVENASLNRAELSEAKTELPKADNAVLPEIERTEVPEAERTELPEAERTELPETERTELPETERTELPETERTVFPETERTVLPETEKTELPETEKDESPETERTNLPEINKKELPKFDKNELPESDRIELPEAEKTQSIENAYGEENIDQNNLVQTGKKSDESPVVCVQKDIQTNCDMVLNVENAVANSSGITVPNISLDQKNESLSCQSELTENKSLEKVNETQNAHTEVSDILTDKSIHSSHEKMQHQNISAISELSNSLVGSGNGPSQDVSTSSIVSCVAVNSECIKKNEDVAEVKVKRRRGRPKKNTNNKVSPKTSKNSQHDSLKTDNLNKVSDEVKEKKADIESPAEPNLGMDDDAPVLAIRKSERVKRRKLVSEETFQIPVVETKPKEEVTPTAPVMRTGRRGRPRKCPIKDPSVESSDGKVEDDVQKASEVQSDAVDENLRKYSRKGRPRKCVRYADLNSGVDSSESLDGLNSGNLGKDKSESVKIKTMKNAHKSSHVKNSEEISDSYNSKEQEENIVLPLKKRKQRQTKKDDSEIENLKSNKNVDNSENVLLIEENEQNSEEEKVSEKNSRSLRSRNVRGTKRKRYEDGEDTSDEDWDPDVHLNSNKQSSRTSRQKSNLDILDLEESSESSSSEKKDPTVDFSKKPSEPHTATRRVTAKPLLRTKAKYSLLTCEEVLTEYKPRKWMWKFLKAEDYTLPPMKNSAYFKIEKVWEKNEVYWNSLSVFDCAPLDKDSCHCTFFVGGPVTCSAWCPVPIDGNKVQYVAVAVNNSMNKTHSYVCDQPEEGLLQLWNVGVLNSKMLQGKPFMELSIFHKYGPITNMTWCPSGCWENPEGEFSEDVLPRLGLLALACSDGCVRIYSIPHPDFFHKEKSGFPVYSSCPSVVLESLNGDICAVTKKSVCISVAWEKSEHCERIAAGYGCGLICIWRISPPATILTIKDHNQTISPYLVFNAHGAPVSGLSFSPLTGGRYLVSSSIDKTLKFWDLLDTSLPIFSVKKGAGKSAEWSSYYCGAFGSIEYGMNNFKGATFFKECGTENFSSRTLSNPSCSIIINSLSEWLHAQAIADIAGNVSVSFMHSLIQEHSKGLQYFHRLVYQSELKPVEGIVDKIIFSSYPESVNCVSKIQEIAEVPIILNKMIEMCCEVTEEDMNFVRQQVYHKDIERSVKSHSQEQYSEQSGEVTCLTMIEQMKDVVSVLHKITEKCGNLNENDNCEEIASSEIIEDSFKDASTNASIDSAAEECCQPHIKKKLSEITDIITVVTDIKDVAHVMDELICQSQEMSAQNLLSNSKIKDSIECNSLIEVDEIYDVNSLDQSTKQDLSIFCADMNDPSENCANIVHSSVEIVEHLHTLITAVCDDKTSTCQDNNLEIIDEVVTAEDIIADIHSENIACISAVEDINNIVTVVECVTQHCEKNKYFENTLNIAEETEKPNISCDTEVHSKAKSACESKPIYHKRMTEEKSSYSETVEHVLQKLKDVISTAEEIAEESCKLKILDVNLKVHEELGKIQLSDSLTVFINKVACSQSKETDNKKHISKRTGLPYDLAEIADIVAAVTDMKDLTDVLLDMKDTTEAVLDMKDTTEAVLDMKDTTEAVLDMKDTTEAVLCLSDTIEIVSDMKNTTDVICDIKDVAEAVLDMNDIITSVEDMKNVAITAKILVSKAKEIRSIENQFLSEISPVLHNVIKDVSEEIDNELITKRLYDVIRNVSEKIDNDVILKRLDDVIKDVSEEIDNELVVKKLNDVIHGVLEEIDNELIFKTLHDAIQNVSEKIDSELIIKKLDDVIQDVSKEIDNEIIVKTLDDIIKDVSEEIDNELINRKLLNEMVLMVSESEKCEYERPCISSDIVENMTFARDKECLKSSDSCKKLISMPSMEFSADKENMTPCNNHVPKIQNFDCLTEIPDEMDEQMLLADSESSNSENDVDTDDEMEVNDCYMFDQDSHLSEDSILSEWSFNSAASVVSFSTESDISEASTTSVFGDQEIDDPVSRNESVITDAGNMSSEFFRELHVQQVASQSQNSNVRCASDVLKISDPSNVSNGEVPVKDTNLNVALDKIVPDAHDSILSDKLSSNEADKTDTKSFCALQKSSLCNEISTLAIANVSDVDCSSYVAPQALTNDAVTNTSCDISSSSAEIAKVNTDSGSETCTESTDKDSSCTENINLRENLPDNCDTNSVLPETVENIFDAREIVESVYVNSEHNVNNENNCCSSKVTEHNIIDSKKTSPKNFSCYEDVISQHGIIFRDMNTAKFEKIQHGNFEELSEYSLQQHHLTSIKSVSWNPNFGSHCWLFSGGQSGIVRLSYISDINQNVKSSRKSK